MSMNPEDVFTKRSCVFKESLNIKVMLAALATKNKRSRQRKRKKMRWGGGASSLHSTLPILQLACLLNQTASWVLVLWVPTPPPPAREASFSESFLFVWL